MNKSLIDFATIAASRVSVGAMLLLACLGIGGPALAGLTQISDTPIVSTTAAAVKPNIMLLMDASDSMAYTHMPDEIETVTGVGSSGYKSSQCNVLYYNPAQSYLLPKMPSGVDYFPVPAFAAARYAGYGDFYLPTKDTTVVDLGAAFKAYDSNSLQVNGIVDAGQPAYYYVHTGGSGAGQLDYAGPTCAEEDLGSRGTENGTWTKVLVSATSGPSAKPDERPNFAMWYAYYRTRIALMKSAASLAFTPLSSAYRVGFITVQPKTLKTDTTIDPSKYLPVADFTGAQRDAWFAKLFSQVPAGSSPAREGLARVGRYYANRHDSINVGMTGDPMQFACQQNFTILTTDGYWNTQSETPDSSTQNGGALDINGIKKIDNVDGFLDSPYTPRPIWDGNAGSTVVSRDAADTYDAAACGLPTLYRSTFTTMQRRIQWTKTFTYNLRRTQTWTKTVAQEMAYTYNITKKQVQTTKTTEQWMSKYDGIREERYKILKTTWQATKTLAQTFSAASQVQTRSYQVQKTETRDHRVSVQYMQTRVQPSKTTVQWEEEKRQFSEESIQTYKTRYRYVSKLKTGETYSPTAACGDPALYDCLIKDKTGPTLVVPSTCMSGTSPDYPYFVTECAPGTKSVALHTTPSCSLGSANSGTPYFVTTTCTDVQKQPPTFRESCTQGTDSSNVRTICRNPPGPNNTVTSGATSCIPDGGSNAPYVHVICGNSIDETTYPNSCALGSSTDVDNITTTCSQPVAGNTDTYVPRCSSSTEPNNQVVTCTRETTFPTAGVDPTTCTGDGIFGAVFRTCTTFPANPAWMPAPSCVASSSTDVNVVQCNPVAGNNYAYGAISQAGGCQIETPSSGNGYLSRSCDMPPANNQTVYTDETTCVNDPGTSSPYIKVTCNGRMNIVGPTLVTDENSCPIGQSTGASPGYIVTKCEKSVTSSGPSGTCSDRFLADGTHIVCQTIDLPAVPSPECTTSGPAYDQTTCYKPAGPNNAVSYDASCATQDPGVSPSFIKTTCAAATVFSPTVVAPGDCTAVNAGQAGPDGTVTICTSNPTGPYTTTTAVASCPVGGADSVSGTTITHCSYGPANNASAQPSAICTDGAVVTSTDGSFTTSTCKYRDESDYVKGPSNCSQHAYDASTGTTVDCTQPTAGSNVVSATCIPDTTNDARPITTTCAQAETFALGPAPADPASCTNFTGSGANPGGTEFVYCSTTTPTAAAADASCTADTPGTAENNYVYTKCSSGSGDGRILRVTHSTWTTTSKVSGNAVVSTSPPAYDAETSAQLTSCLASNDPAVQLPVPNPKKPALPSGCTAWPCIVSRTDADVGSKNSLADVAQYYYMTDLRADFPNKDKVSSEGEDDDASHQHMTTFVVGLGVSGTVKYQADYRSTATIAGDFAKIRCKAPAVAVSGVDCMTWPVWPDPSVGAVDASGNFLNTDLYNNPKSIDDFWHTAVNGRGTYFSATDPTSVIDGIGSALSTISATNASGAGDAASTFEPTSTNHSVFTANYQTGNWVGDLQAFEINLVTGALAPKIWSASDNLDQQTRKDCDSRTIYLLRMGAESTTDHKNLVDFALDTSSCPAGGLPGTTRAGTLDPTELAYFDASKTGLLAQNSAMDSAQRSAAPGKNLVNFLRGQRGFEGFKKNVDTTLFRTRAHVLGDIVGSQPLYVGRPFARYRDAGYANFIRDNLTRAPMVYVGANDGMLHAFYATAKDTDATYSLRGQEAWAVIPQTVLPNMYKLADTSYTGSHQFFVDGSPVAGDVYDGTWHTILVGGLNAGGKGYYALDVTDPVKPKALWEFRGLSGVCPSTSGSPSPADNLADCNLGLTFGKPVITKIGSQWVVMVTSGYNNVSSASNGGDGGGFLYVIDAMTGKLVKKIYTGVGSNGDPSGLAQINNFVDSTFLDNTTVRAYGGDLLGNIWRFEFANAGSATLIGVAKDGITGTAKPQPITTRPEVAEIDHQPMIFVGTGKFLGSNDVTDAQAQSIYGIVDPLTAGPGPVYADLRGASLRPLTMTQQGIGPSATRTVTCAGAACSRTAGWFLDLPEVGERINVPMQLVFGSLVIASNVPKEESCTVGGHSWFTLLNYRTGEPVPGATLVNGSDPTSGNTTHYIADSLVAGFNLYKLPAKAGDNNNNGTLIVDFKLTDGGHGKGGSLDLQGGPPSKRVSWREIPQ